MSESNGDREPFVPSAPTLDWVIAMYYREITSFLFNLILSSTWFYRFVYAFMFIFPITMIIIVLVVYFNMKSEQERIEKLVAVRVVNKRDIDE